MVIDPWSVCALCWDSDHLACSDPTLLHGNDLCRLEKGPQKTVAADAGPSRLFHPVSNADLPWYQGNWTYGNDYGESAAYAYGTRGISQRFFFQSRAAIF